MIWALITLVLNTSAQVVLKYSTKVAEPIFASISFLTWPFSIAMGLYVISVLTWVQALREMSLSQAYPIMAATLITVPLAAAYFFKDEIHPAQWGFLGLAFVGLAGFAMFSK